MPLKNTTAVHSAMMDPLLPEFRQFLETIRGHPPEIPYISNLTGKWITVEDALRPGYWTDHMRKTVRFSDGIKELTREPGSIFIEIGPGRDLSAIISRFIHEKQGQHVVNLAPTPGQQVSDMHYLVNKLGQIWLYGVNINWQAFHSPEKRHRIPLPVYPFQGKPYRVREKFPDQPVQIWEKESPSRMRRKTDISDWFYIPSWKRSVLLSPSPEARSRSCCWLFFPDRHRLADSIKKRLEKEGHNVITVISGPEFVKKGDRQYCINPQNSRDYQLLFQELAQSGILPERILHLWSVNPPGAHRENTAGLWNEQVQYKGFYSLIYLVKALVKQHINQEIRLEVITSNVCKITGDEVICPERAVILGPVKVIPQEYPFIISRHIDILVPEPGSPGEQELSDRLYAELTTPAPDTVVAYRGGLRWVQVFDPLQLRETHRKPPLLKEKGVYLITGGTGSIGLMLARYLVKSVKGKLILVSRSGLPPRQEWEQRINSPQGDAIARKIEAITELEKAGGEVLVMAADVSNRQRWGTWCPGPGSGSAGSTA
jgi:acyl transferase domain-containing protein